MTAPIVTLLTDFGLRDSYVGVMKGVIAHIAPTATQIDLTHEIPPQDIAAARFNLKMALPYFPPGTVHLVVVDPGVGSDRAPVAIACDDYLLVGPNNGVFSWIEATTIRAMVKLTNSAYWRSPTLSHTFHGRDVFAPAAAHLAAGVPIEQMGEPMEPAQLVDFRESRFQPSGSQVTGTVQYIDHFGNAVTSISSEAMQGQNARVKVKGRLLPLVATYADQPIGALVALIGSHGWLEIAVNQGSAQQQLGLQLGEEVTLDLIASD